jgi:hypothetical protein
MFMTYLCAIFHMPSYENYGSFVIVVNGKDKNTFPAAATLLLYI